MAAQGGDSGGGGGGLGGLAMLGALIPGFAPAYQAGLQKRRQQMDWQQTQDAQTTADRALRGAMGYGSTVGGGVPQQPQAGMPPPNPGQYAPPPQPVAPGQASQPKTPLPQALQQSGGLWGQPQGMSSTGPRDMAQAPQPPQRPMGMGPPPPMSPAQQIAATSGGGPDMMPKAPPPQAGAVPAALPAQGGGQPQQSPLTRPHVTGLTAPGAQVKAAILDQFRKEGFNPRDPNVAASMLTGEADAESGFNPRVSHDQDTGYGIYGARADRKDRMLEWMKEAGFAPDSLEGQARYMAHEALTRFPEAKKILASADKDSATSLMPGLTKNFENPAVVNNRNAAYLNAYSNTFAKAAKGAKTQANAVNTTPEGQQALAQARENNLSLPSIVKWYIAMNPNAKPGDMIRALHELEPFMNMEAQAQTRAITEADRQQRAAETKQYHDDMTKDREQRAAETKREHEAEDKARLERLRAAADAKVEANKRAIQAEQDKLDANWQKHIDRLNDQLTHNENALTNATDPKQKAAIQARIDKLNKQLEDEDALGPPSTRKSAGKQGNATQGQGGNKDPGEEGLKQAQDAIDQGADYDEVAKLFKENGGDPRKLKRPVKGVGTEGGGT